METPNYNKREIEFRRTVSSIRNHSDIHIDKTKDGDHEYDNDNTLNNSTMVNDYNESIASGQVNKNTNDVPVPKSAAAMEAYDDDYQIASSQNVS